MIRSEKSTTPPKPGSIGTLLLCFIAGMVVAFLFWWFISRL